MIETAIIGYGGVARSHLADIQFFSPDNPLRADDDPIVHLVACADISPKARNQFQQDTGVSAVYESTEQMLQQHSPDYVHVCTCADAHVGPVLAAAQAGVHVLCEKPLATEPAECDRMIEACRAFGVQFVVSHQRRSDPRYWHVRRFIDAGKIGTLRYITAGGKPRMGGRELHNIGSHLIDAMGIFAGDVEWVFAQCTVEGRPATIADRQPGDRGAGAVIGDRVDLTIGYADGPQAHMTFNDDPGDMHWILWGTEGRIASLDRELWHCDGPEVRPDDQWRPLQIPPEPPRTAAGYTFRPGWPGIIEARGTNNRVFMMREIFHRMRRGGEHTSTGRIGAVPIEVMQAAFISHLQGAKVQLPLQQRTSPLTSGQ